LLSSFLDSEMRRESREGTEHHDELEKVV